MDKSAIKNFAVWARRKLIEDIRQKAYEIGITEGAAEEVTVLSSDLAKVRERTLDRHELKQRQSLLSRIDEKGYREVIEEAAFTWFNRLIALRFMEVSEYLPSGIRVLSSMENGRAEPDIIRQFEYIDLGLSEKDLSNLRQMQDNNDTEGLFRFLLIKQCNKLNEILPVLFEEIQDYTEILLPNNLLSEGSIIKRLISDIEEEDFKDQVEIIGWLYQYYISEKKDEVFEGLKKNVKISKENIPAATQLFTPDWIVKYMVENSLGRLWLEGHYSDELKDSWKYYVYEAEQEPDAERLLDKIRKQVKIESPEDIKVLDPAMGSGHILVYAFDVLYEIYKSAGYSERDIPRLILEKNLYGLEIDDRAAQLAYFAVMMKARSKSRRIFREKIELNICSIQESNTLGKEAAEYFRDEKIKKDIEYLIDMYFDAKEYGSIIDVKPIDFDGARRRLEEIEDADLPVYELQMRNTILYRVYPLLKQAGIMSQKYHVVCTNPPYMGNGNMNSKMLSFVKRFYGQSKNDLYAVFIERGIKYCCESGMLSMITQQSWLFLSSFALLRANIIRDNMVYSLLHLGPRTFEEIGGEVVQSAAFILRKADLEKYTGSFFKLTWFNNAREKESMFLRTLGSHEPGIRYLSSASSFFKIPGAPISYWVSDRVRDVFNEGESIDKYGKPRRALQTGDSQRFIRYWYEVSQEKLAFNMENREQAIYSKYKWFFFNNGGTFRKWFGSIVNVVDWENNGESIKSTGKAIIPSEQHYFQRCIYWNKISTGKMSVKFQGSGIIPGDASPCFFSSSDAHLLYIIGLLNSKVANVFFEILSPTLNFQSGDVGRIPVLDCSREERELINKLVLENIKISKAEWDSYETSWDFERHPLLMHKQNARTIKQAFDNWSDFAEKQFIRLKSNEEELNRIFIKIYSLQDELGPEVDEGDVTLRKADRVRDIKSFISYAVGCMFGRYSIDVDSLIYGGGEWNDKWRIEDGKLKVRRAAKDGSGNREEGIWADAAFGPDKDNVIPVLDDEYFTDDIVSRFVEFVGAAFGSETMEANLDYIAEAIGRKPSGVSRQAIRRYFLKEFYKDHLQVYQKKPIYWLLDSGKNDGFKALIYMHRYDEYTAAQVRTDYLHRLQRMYEAEYNRLDIVIDSSASEREKAAARKKKEKLQKQLAECREFDQVIAHAANMRIIIDLDDGASVNYKKFQGIEVPQGEGRKPLKADLLASI